MSKQGPARAIIKRAPHRSVGAISALWLQSESIEWESQLERRCIFASIAFWGTAKISHQPFRIPLQLGHRSSKYVPDFLVELVDGSKIVIEVKPFVYVEKHRERLNNACGWLAHKGIGFVVLTDKQLDHPAWQHTVPMLLQCARWDIDMDIRAQILMRLSDAGGRLLLRDLVDGADVKTKIPVLHMLGRREIHCDPRSWQGDETEISLFPNATHDTFQQGDQHECKPDATDSFFKWFGVTQWGADSGLQEGIG